MQSQPESKKREDFLVYMDDLLGEYPEQEGMEFHIIMDNYCTHKKNDAQARGASKRVLPLCSDA